MSEPSAPMFDPVRFEQQLAATDAVRRSVLAAIVFGWAASWTPPLAMTVWPTALMLGGIGLWLLAGHVSNRATRCALEAARSAATPDGEADLDRALGRGLRRFTLYRSIRVMLYHHLAILRARQRRDEEAAAICATLLGSDLVPVAGGQRAKLLLLCVEVALRRGELLSAWSGLAELARGDLPLDDRLRRMELLTRYEAACGRWRQVLSALASKVDLSELMAPHRAAAMHHRLGEAARRLECEKTAEWLNTRAQLLELDGAGPADESEYAPWDDGLAGPARAASLSPQHREDP